MRHQLCPIHLFCAAFNTSQQASSGLSRRLVDAPVLFRPNTPTPLGLQQHRHAFGGTIIADWCSDRQRCPPCRHCRHHRFVQPRRLACRAQARVWRAGCAAGGARRCISDETKTGGSVNTGMQDIRNGFLDSSLRSVCFCVTFLLIVSSNPIILPTLCVDQARTFSAVVPSSMEPNPFPGERLVIYVHHRTQSPLCDIRSTCGTATNPAAVRRRQGVACWVAVMVVSL